MENLEDFVERVLERFPKVVDSGLKIGCYRLLSLTCGEFLEVRAFGHLKRIVLVQFFLQKKMEQALSVSSDRNVFLRLFLQGNRICLAVCISKCHEQENVNRSFLLQALQFVLPGMKEIPRSFFSWSHPELPYCFLYIEGQRLRGRHLFQNELKVLQKTLERHIFHSAAPLFPPVFWPYNQEEIYHQLLNLKKQICSKKDFPHLLIHFREQVSHSLEFLIHLVIPKTPFSMEERLHRLPSKVQLFHHLHYAFDSPFPIEGFVFSFFLPSDLFYDSGAINLLHARRSIVKDLEAVIGSFRDCNGGLFEKQQSQFQHVKSRFLTQIPDAHLFDEKIFYALKPIEAQMNLSSQTIELLFSTFQKAFNEMGSFCFLEHKNKVIIIKSPALNDLMPFMKKIKGFSSVASAHARIAHFHYFCVVDETSVAIEMLKEFHQKSAHSTPKKTTLKLNFLEGDPLSLSPLFLFRDMRCRALSKLLFEGMTRMDKRGKATLAGAGEIKISSDGLNYEVKLKRHGWSNGERVTAFHYEQSWKQILACSERNPYIVLFFPIKNAKKMIEGKVGIEEVGFRAVDEGTFQFELETVDPTFVNRLSHPLFFPMYDPKQDPKWFNGPYQIINYASSGLLLERNPFFWDKRNSGFESIEISLNNNFEEAYSLFEKKELDWIGEPFSALRKAFLKRTKKVRKRKTTRFFWLHFNTTTPSLRSSAIRRALSLALDRKYICKHILNCDEPLYTPLPPSLSSCSEPFSENSVEALALFRKGVDELGLKTFPPLVILYSPFAGGIKLAEYFASTWEKVFNVPVRIEKEANWNIFQSQLERGEYQIAGYYDSLLYEDPYILLDRFDRLDAYDFSGWQNNSYSEKMKLIHGLSLTSSERKQILIDVENLLVAEAPFIPISMRSLFYAHHEGLKGLVFDKGGCPDFRWASFNLKPKEEKKDVI